MTGGEDEQVHREMTALQAQHADALRLCGLCFEDLKALEGDRPVMVSVRLVRDIDRLRQHLCDLHAELEDMDTSPDPPLLSINQDGLVTAVVGAAESVQKLVDELPKEEVASYNTECPRYRDTQCTGDRCLYWDTKKGCTWVPTARYGPPSEPRAEQAGYVLEQQEDY